MHTKRILHSTQIQRVFVCHRPALQFHSSSISSSINSSSTLLESRKHSEDSLSLTVSGSRSLSRSPSPSVSVYPFLWGVRKFARTQRQQPFSTSSDRDREKEKDSLKVTPSPSAASPSLPLSTDAPTTHTHVHGHVHPSTEKDESLRMMQNSIAAASRAGAAVGVGAGPAPGSGGSSTPSNTSQGGNINSSNHSNDINNSNNKHLSSYYAAASNTAHLIGDTLHKNVEQLYNRWYEDMEVKLMVSVNESNRRRFRIYFFGSIGLMILTTVVFGDRIRKAVTDQTADIAKETLENESLKIQTQELAMAVVQTVLNDKEITAHAASFLKEASNAAETQQALLDLTLHVLQHPKCVQELLILSNKLVNELSAEPEVLAKLGELVVRLIEDPTVKAALTKLVFEVLNDPEVLKEATNVALAVIAQPDVLKATQDLLTQSSAKVLEDPEIAQQSRQFITDVVGDELLHREGGNALWKTVYYALKPGVVRITGLGLVVGSIAAIRCPF